MKRYLVIILSLWIGIGEMMAGGLPASLQVAAGDSIFVYLANGRLDVYPYTTISDYTADENQMVIKTTDNTSHIYGADEIESVSLFAPTNKPSFVSFTFNHDDNRHLLKDVTCKLAEDGTMTATVPAIGKWLAPSFECSDNEAKVYVGRDWQHSRTTRQSFAQPVAYVVTRDGWQVMTPSASEEGMAFQPYGTRYTVDIYWPTDNATSIPAIYITTENGELPKTKETYLKGTFAIDGGGVFADMEETAVNIKGRGNTSWTTPTGTGDYKNPYRLKFESSVKPFGMTKGKNWVLLANNIHGSMMANAIGMKVAQLASTRAVNHMVPVDLYINGDYRGSYLFTEKIGFSNNSIDLDDETGATLLELDTYNDETIYRAKYYNVPVKIHEPEFDDEKTDTQLTPDSIMADFNRMLETACMGGDIAACVDLDAFTAYYLTNEYILNMELLHPKSTYLYKEHVGQADDLWVFGPVWDLDWAFGHELDYGYFTTGATADYVNAKEMECNNLWRALRQAGEAQDKAYYLAWTRFLRQKGVEELVDFCQEYYDYVKPSFEKNQQKWGDGSGYAAQIAKQQQWLKDRAAYVYGGLKAYDLSEVLPEEPLWQPYDQHNAPAGISSIDQSQADGITIYDLHGRHRSTLQKGINILRYRNGKSKVIYVAP